MGSPPSPVKPRIPARSTHLFLRTLSRYLYAHLIALSWLLWLLSVVVFVFLMKASFQPATRAEWFGLAIRTGVYSLWALVLREWFAIRVS